MGYRSGVWDGFELFTNLSCMILGTFLSLRERQIIATSLGYRVCVNSYLVILKTFSQNSKSIFEP
jgi:hypothetical protein